jgi:subtilisin family serine protease
VARIDSGCETVIRGKAVGGRFLIKAGARLPQTLRGAPLTFADSAFVLEKLFDAPSSAAGPGVAAQPPHSWYIAATETPLPAADVGIEWDAAHRLYRELTTGLGLAPGADVVAVEPDLEHAWLPLGAEQILAVGEPCQARDQKGPPLAQGSGFAWHLGDDYTGLKRARDAVGVGGAVVTIAHLDTGYDENHVLLPERLDRGRQRNFVDTDRPNDARDRTASGMLRNPGHGMGTLGILAGAKTIETLPVTSRTGDYLGGAPRAAIVPMRVADSVVHFWTSSVAKAFEEARKLHVDVISMSMGGLPSLAWADAVNAAYDAGIVIVCAAGNNFGRLPTPHIVYPARFNRVIAACGIMADGRPYFGLPLTTMQGNIGPASRMTTALAAYTPNIPWAKQGCATAIDLDGAGTSAATPQIAAAAALWLARHKDGLPSGWERAELARQALFRSAAKSSAAEPESTVARYFGNGILRADKALECTPAKLGALSEPPRDSATFPIFRLLTGLGVAPDPAASELLALEMTQLAQSIASVRNVVEDPDVQRSRLTDKDSRRLAEILLDDGRCSNALRVVLEPIAGRGARPAPSAPEGAPPGAGVDEERHQLGSQLPRRRVSQPPPHRQLRIFALDPSFANRIETAMINVATVRVPWESDSDGRDSLKPGPVGEYLEVVDVDPQSGLAYAPVNLDHPHVLATNGLDPSLGNPQFHQQMVYAVAMQTIGHFERALGRSALWAPRHWRHKPAGDVAEDWDFVRRLRVYPHALRQANAYYSPDKVALLFGYFPAQPASGGAGRPGGLVFTCLSHDIIAHETSHALLDGLHRRFREPSNPDTLAFHEAFSDIVAIFQHFTYPEILRHEIAGTRGDLNMAELLGKLAHEFGEALGYSKALRSAIGADPEERNYANTFKPHDRGAVLVATVFRAFVTIYERRVADLFRIATGGSGVLPAGALHPDLVNRLAEDAATIAKRVLTICIRALDYCPPVDITFPDYLRALVTADSDLVPDDRDDYRLAFLEAFETYRIYPEGVRTISVESLRWRAPLHQLNGFDKLLGRLDLEWTRRLDRRAAHRLAKENGRKMHAWLARYLAGKEDLAEALGLSLADDAPFEVHSVRPARRVTPDGTTLTDVIAVITQSRDEPYDPKHPQFGTFRFRGGCTLVLDPHDADAPIRYAVTKRIGSERRLEAQRRHRLEGAGTSLHAMYFGGRGEETFALCHMGH